MKPLIPAVRAVMARRILINFRVKPEAVARLLPPSFRPRLVNGWAMAGVCLIRLEDTRPVWMPRWCGVASENAAHRIAVEWTEDGRSREGVFVPRRDTNSLLIRFAGGRLFPGVHHLAKFRCKQSGARFEVEFRSRDGETRVKVAARRENRGPADSVFGSLDEASEFFRAGRCGWSPSNGCGFEGVELHTETWTMHGLSVERAESSFFSDPRRFPPGSIEFDSALLMLGVGHEWRALGRFEEPRRSSPRPHHRAAAFFEMP
ncbi:MAG: DUF2071 domain-containing protein [Verrucomicrobiales bacterium]|nr:DUF2071 domain-containing protein [Verrucomicrobiales bacterium]